MVSEHARKFPHGHWSFLGPGSEQKWYGTNTYKLDGQWDRVADLIVLNFAESGHPISRGTSAFERGTLKTKRGGNFCGDSDTIEVILPTIISAN